MTGIHRIRLHGPWQARVLEQKPGTGKAGSPGEFVSKIPSSWTEVLGPRFAGRVRYRRIFHCPANLLPDQVVELVVERVNREAEVILNGTSLGRAGWDLEFRQNIAQRLIPQNVLLIDVCCPVDLESTNEPGGLVGSVALEIHEG